MIPGQRERAERDYCQVYWGSHGCMFAEGHDGPCVCACCECDGPTCEPECVARPPYYGPDTRFYGEGAVRLGLKLHDKRWFEEP